MRKTNKKQGKIKQMLLSLVLAIIVWAGVVYVNPPEMTTTIYNLPVRVTGLDTLEEKSLTVVGRREIDGLSVSVTGKRNDLLSLSGDIFVDVDVSSLNSTGTYNLPGNVTLPSSKLAIAKVNFESVPVTVDTVETKEIDIDVEQAGTSDKLIKTTADVDKVVLTGAKSELSEVNRGIITADISEIKDDTELENGYVLVNKNGSLITKNETIEASLTRVNVLYTVYEKVSLPVEIRLSDELGAEYSADNAKSTISPSEVEIGIRKGSVVPTAVYAEITENKDEVKGTLIEEEGMYIPEALKTVTVKPHIEKKATADITVVPSYKNLNGSLTASVGSIVISAEGAQSALNANNITAYVDLTDYEVGEYSVPVVIESKSLSVKQEYYAAVTVTKR